MTLYHHPAVMGGILIIAFLICAGCTQSPVPEPFPPSTPLATVTAGDTPVITPSVAATPRLASKEEMVAFVKEAVAYAHQNGKEKSLAEFSNTNGSFFRGELYIYAYDINGTTIAHPVNPEKIGVNRLGEKDAEGNLFIRDLRQAAVNGTGFVTYYYLNPVHNNTVEKKLGYGMSVDETWFLGSGVYLGTDDLPEAPVNVTLPAAGVTTTYPGR